MVQKNALGRGLGALIEDAGQEYTECLANPGSITGITPMVQDILMILEDWHFARQTQPQCFSDMIFQTGK